MFLSGPVANPSKAHDTKFMSRDPPVDEGVMARWTFFTNHLHVLSTLAAQPDLRLREVASKVGISERATHRIVCELVDEGYLTRTRVGSRNHYKVHLKAALRRPEHAGESVGRVIGMLAGHDAPHEQAEPRDRDRPRERDLPPTLTVDAECTETFRELFRTAPVGMVVGDQSGALLAVNPAFCTILERAEDELLGRDFRAITHEDDIAVDETALRELASGVRSEYVREKRYVRPDGSPVWVRLRGAMAIDPDTGARVFVAHVVDISERRRREQALAEAEDRFRSAFDNAPIGMALVAPDGRFIKVNRALCDLTGYSETHLLTRSFQAITHPDDLDADLAHVQDVLADRRRTYQMEKRYYHADGHIIWVTLSVSLVRDAGGEPLYFISQIEDISSRKQRERALETQAARLAVIAATDQLTGLSTRRAWDLAIADRTSHPDEGLERFGIALIDLDALKEINDTRGHHAGDQALVAMASALRTVVRDEDLVARIGGDEFAVLIPSVSAEAMLALTGRILAVLPENLSASAGVATWDGSESPVELQHRADRALYAAKHAGKGRACLAGAQAGGEAGVSDRAATPQAAQLGAD
ncbi:MAG TPA: PAS domain S-box protein [Solirubrobacteraceae bacterium]|nr:PAS domain S-box protein [Solirubrobacteraceae bacterium]